MTEFGAGTHARAGKSTPENGYALRSLGAIRQQTAPEQALAGLEQAARMLPNDPQAPDRRTEERVRKPLVCCGDLAGWCRICRSGFPVLGLGKHRHPVMRGHAPGLDALAGKRQLPPRKVPVPPTPVPSMIATDPLRPNVIRLVVDARRRGDIGRSGQFVIRVPHGAVANLVSVTS